MSILSSQQSTNINLLRSQLLQTIVLNLNEAFSLLISSSSNKHNVNEKNSKAIDTALKNALAQIVANEEAFIIDKLLVPLLSTTQQQPTLYEARNGFRSDDLLKSEYKPKLETSILFGNRKSVNYTTCRGFKTEQRVGRKEFGQSIMKRYLNPTEPNDPIDSIKTKQLNSLMGRNQRLGSLLNNSTSNNQIAEMSEDDKVKYAFAEGFLTRDKLMDYQNKSVFKSLLAKLGNIVSYGLLVALLFATFFIYKTLFPSDISTPDIGAKPGSMANQKPKFGSLFGSHTFQEVKPEEISAKFKDVKGVPEAKLELQEVVDYLKDTEKYTRLGGRLPKGVLLVGPPGTGKTLLAKAVAGEASVPFFHCSGSEFDEMFVGTGARKMRQLFQAARARAPCVIFIDEIDSVGAKRTNSMAHPYANQTINQMLAEMDGFLVNEGIIVLGATNRRNQLDPALLRPGRFDLEVNVGVPDIRGRAEILEHYLKKVVLSADADVEILSRLTVGFTGADLENLVNQAALRAALENDVEVRMKHLQWSFDRIKMGAAKLSRIPDEKTNRCTAYHEAGHTIVSFYTKESMKPHKVTIIQRGQALGVTAFAPEEKDLYGFTKAQLIAFIDVAMGGRAAEEITFGSDQVGAGASSDLTAATNYAKAMVMTYGMSETFGLRAMSNTEEQLSSETREKIDSEVRKILNESYERAKSILLAHPNEFRLLAETLLKYETLDASEITFILENNKLPNTLTVDRQRFGKNPVAI